MAEFPPEVWFRVIQYLQAYLDPEFPAASDYQFWGPTQTLASLCLTSRRFYTIAQPLLYSSLGKDGPKNPKTLMDMLSARPDLAGLVRRFDTRFLVYDRPSLLALFEKARENLDLPEHVIEHLDELLSDSSMDEDEQGLYTTVSHATIIICMGLFPHLKVLEFADGYDYEPDSLFVWFADYMNARQQRSASSSGRKYFSELRDLYMHDLDPQDITSVSSFQQLLPIFPSLKRFYASAVEWDSTLATESPACRLGLVKANLSLSLIQAAGFRDLLTLCPSLQSLEIDWVTLEGHDCPLHLGSFGSSLREFGRNLVELSLYCCQLYEYEYNKGDPDGCSGRLGSLRSLRHLKCLALPMDILVGWEDPEGEDESEILTLESCLPEGLQVLTLYSGVANNEKMRQEMRDVFTSQRLSHLEAVHVDQCPDLDDLLEDCGWEADCGPPRKFTFRRKK